MTPYDIKHLVQLGHVDQDFHMQAAAYVLTEAVPREVRAGGGPTRVGHWMTEPTFTDDVIDENGLVNWPRATLYTVGPKSDGEKAALRLACSLAGFCDRGRPDDWSLYSMSSALDPDNQAIARTALDILWWGPVTTL